MVVKKGAPAQPIGPPTLAKVAPPQEHLQMLYQRFESLISSIVTLREEINMIPGVDEWPALLNRYANLLSHAYSVSASLMSASPHFLPSQLTAFNKVLEAEARNANLYSEAQGTSSALFGGFRSVQADGVPATADGLPELTYHDPESQLPILLAHPLLPIAEDKLNFLGAILRTAPEPEIAEEESKFIADYDEQANAGGLDMQQDDDQGNSQDKVAAEIERIQEEISQHDILALRALRTWYHVQQAPDEDGNVMNFKDRIPREAEDDGEQEDEDEDEEMDDGASEKSAAERKRKVKHRKQLEQNTWSAESISSFMHRGLTTTAPP